VLSFVRRHGYAPQDAEDLTQDFFASCSSRAGTRAPIPAAALPKLPAQRLAAFISDARDSASAQKARRRTAARGRRRKPLPRSPQRRGIARAGLHAALDEDRGRSRHAKAGVGGARGGQAGTVRATQSFLAEAPDPAAYRELGEKLGMRPNTIAVGVHRMRQRLRDLVREELLQTVADAGPLERSCANCAPPSRTPQGS
jgi:RNA polymerase sigma-70 factor (ECF subfamily)